jgi:hypothetical protein
VVSEIPPRRGGNVLDTIDTDYIELTATSQRELDPELAAWFSEAIRLFVEASDRAATGNVRSALSSLAAVPRVHSFLVKSCAELLGRDAGESAEPAPSAPGLYL